MFDITSSQANFWFDTFNVVLFLGALAVAVGTYGAIKMGAIKERFSDERVATNESQTARANEAAAVANKSAAEANERTARLGQETEELRAKNLDLERTYSPRSINNGVVATALKPFNDVLFQVISIPDAEPRRTAGQLAATLLLAGWQRFSSGLQYGLDDFRDGVAIEWGSDSNNPNEPPITRSWQARLALMEMLEKSGIATFPGGRRSEIPPNAIVILVGFKPVGLPPPKEIRDNEPLRGNINLGPPPSREK